MTVVNPKSISGINSITTGSGSDNLLTIHTSDASSTERVRINSSGDVIVGSGITVSPDGDIFATGVTTSTTFSGNFSGGTVSGTTGIVTTLTATGLTVDSGTTNTCATFKSSDAGAVINLTDSAARSSIEQNDTTLKIIADTDASDADSKIQFQVDASTKATIDSSGNLGLGINSPTAASSETALHVYANEYPEVHLTSSVTGSNAGDGSIFTLNNDSSTIIRNQENSYIRFDTNGSNERMRILAAGGITFNGDTTAANALDDYEEGTWTPQSNIGSITVTTAHYVKIGSLVYFQAYLTFPSMSGSSEVQVTNFPFDVAGTADYLSCSVNSDANVGGAQLVGQFNDGGFLVFAKPDNSKATIPDMSSKFVLFACTIMTH